jgi:K+ transporter
MLAVHVWSQALSWCKKRHLTAFLCWYYGNLTLHFFFVSAATFFFLCVDVFLIFLKAEMNSVYKTVWIPLLRLCYFWIYVVAMWKHSNQYVDVNTHSSCIENENCGFNIWRGLQNFFNHGLMLFVTLPMLSSSTLFSSVFPRLLVIWIHEYQMKVERMPFSASSVPRIKATRTWNSSSSAKI